MRVLPSHVANRFLFACLVGLSLSSPITSFGITVDDLRNTPGLTPKKFASYFRNFDFKFRREVQSPEAFLATQSGDCDDYSTLAASVLSEKGYTPRLIAVRMPGITHVVCYIEETGSYLDYNARGFWNRLVRSENSLEAIARSVASSYGTKWTSASEFTYEDGVKRLVATVVEPEKEESRFASLFR